ncbi:MAG: type II toxin-antitoxin system VapC family toxin [Ignavibacteriae bacterium]|nr:type II toxin-antitoxin system VapC family toxin [Ignavibacteriota bacterium]
MAKPSVYIETTIPSYLVSRPTRDVVISANQQMTRDWWRERRTEFDMFVSDVVREEILRGDPEMSRKRAEIVRSLPILEPNETVDGLVRIYKAHIGLPLDAAPDIAHISYAVAYEMDYLLTWNCKHIANGAVIRRLQKVNGGLGVRTPTIVTPYELLYSKEGEEDV